MPLIPKSFKDSCVTVLVFATWFIYFVMSSTCGKIDHYQDPPESERIHENQLINP